MDTSAAYAQSPDSCRREESQLGLAEEMPSISALIQCSAVTLENECLTLQNQIETESKSLLELKENCSTQAENNLKQQAELDLLTLKTHTETMNRMACLAKISKQRKLGQTLEKYFSDWVNDINLSLLCTEELPQIFKQISINNQQEIADINLLAQNWKNCSNQVEQTLHHLETLRVKEKKEFDEIKNHLKTDLSQQAQQEKDLQEQLGKLDVECREKVTTINILLPSVEEQKKSLENLQKDLEKESQSVKSTTEQLQSTLQEQLRKKAKLTADIEATDNSIAVTTKTIGDTELEIKELSCNQRERLSKEEEYIKACQIEQEELNKLQLNYNSMQKQLTTLMNIKEENNSLKLQCDNLDKINEDYKNKVVTFEELGESHHNKLETTDKLIEEMKNERSKIINEQLIIEGKIEELKKEMNDITDEHKQLSIELGNVHTDSLLEHDSLTATNNALAEQISLANENKINEENKFKKLKTDLERAEAMSQESYFKFFGYIKDCDMIIKDLEEHNKSLSEMLFRTEQDYRKTQSDSQMYEKIKEEITQMDIILKTNHEAYGQSLEELREHYKKEIEKCSENMTEIRAQYENEYRNKEQMKLDAIIELKENKARIADLKQQILYINSDIQNSKINLGKYDNLLNKLRNKLSRVAKVAGAPASQCSQMLNLPSAKNLLENGMHCAFPSPGSSSSGLTYNPDEADFIKANEKMTLLSQQPLQKRNIPTKKKSIPEPPKKKNDVPDFDDWSFLD